MHGNLIYVSYTKSQYKMQIIFYNFQIIYLNITLFLCIKKSSGEILYAIFIYKKLYNLRIFFLIYGLDRNIKHKQFFIL
jgi:hypothetical protein